MSTASCQARFRVMGSDAHVVVCGTASLLASARRRLDDLEQKWSRFLPESEVSRLNTHTGAAVAVSADTVLLVLRAVDGWRATGGWFDPLLLDAVRTAGYDRSFEQLAARAVGTDAMDDRGRTTEEEPQRRAAGVRHDRGQVIAIDPAAISPGAIDPTAIDPTAIEIDPGGLVRLPVGAGFDPGGLGKGLAADVVAAEVMAEGADGVCVNVGGDLRVMGEAPDGAGWRIDVDAGVELGGEVDAGGSGGGLPLYRVALADGGVASTSRLRRRWRQDGEHRHHLIDPLTHAPSQSDVVAVTVMAAQGWQAEVLTKAAFLGGAEGGRLIERCRAAALIVRTGGRSLTVGQWATWAVGTAA